MLLCTYIAKPLPLLDCGLSLDGGSDPFYVIL